MGLTLNFQKESMNDFQKGIPERFSKEIHGAISKGIQWFYKGIPALYFEAIYKKKPKKKIKNKL